MPLILLLFLLLAPASVLADTVESANATYAIPALEVTAPVPEEPATSTYHIPESSKAATWQVGRREIEAMHPTSLFDIVRYAPGLQVSFQGRKSMNFVQGRGGGLYAFVIDGVYIPWTQAGRVLANFPTNTIESVTVVRDSTVLTLGPVSQLGVQESTLQGFILIRTHASDTLENEVRLGYASNDHVKAYARHGNRIDAFRYSLAVNSVHDGGHKDWNTAYDSTSVLASADYVIEDFSARLSLYADWASREIQRSTADSKTADSKWKYDPLRTVMLSGTMTRKWNASQSTMLGAYFGKVDTDLVTQSYSTPAETIYDQEDRSLQFDLRHVITTGDNTLTLGGQSIFWETPTGQFYYETYPRKEELYAAYVQDEYHLTKALTLDGGLRYEQKHITDGVDKSGPTQVTADVIEDQWATPAYSISGGLAWWPSEIWKLSLRTSVEHQAADSFLTTVTGEDLDARTEWRRELGVNAYLHPMFNPSLTIFSYDISNMKAVVASVGKGVNAINIYDAVDVVRNGLEIGLNGVLVPDTLHYTLSYSWQDSDERDDDRTLPENTLSGSLGFTHDPFKANLLFTYVSGYDSNFFSTDGDYHRIGDYTRVDANVSYDFTLLDVDSTLTLYGQNLLDQHYETRLGWKDVGLIVGLELGCRF